MKFTSVKERILVAFFVYSTISFAVSTTSFFLFRDLETVDIAASEVNRLYNQVLNGLRIGQQFFTYELNDEEFYLTGNSPSTLEHEKIFTDIIANISTLKSDKKTADLDMGNDLEKLEILLLDYNRLYKESIEQLQARGYKEHGLIGELRREIHEIEEACSNDLDLILSIRRLEKDYLIRKDTAYVYQMVDYNKQLKDRILASNEFSQFKKRRLSSLLAQYYTNLLKVVTIDQRLGFQSSNEVSGGLAPSLQIKIEQISDLIQAINNRAVDQKYDLNTRVKVILVSIVTLSIILTLFLSISFKFVLEEDIDSIEEL